MLINFYNTKYQADGDGYSVKLERIIKEWYTLCTAPIVPIDIAKKER